MEVPPLIVNLVFRVASAAANAVNLMQIIMADPPLATEIALPNAAVMPAQPAADRHNVQHRLSAEKCWAKLGDARKPRPRKIGRLHR